MSSSSHEKSDDKKKGAGVPWKFGAAGSRVVSAGTRRTAGQSFLAVVASFFSSGTGMLALTAVVGAASLLSLWTMNRQRDAADSLEDGTQTLGENRGSRAYEGTAAPRQASAGGGDSLGYLSRANPGASFGDDGQPIVDAAPNPASPGAVGSGAVPDNTNAPANAPTANPANFQKSFGQLSTATGGGAAYGGMPMASHLEGHHDKPLLAQAPGAGASTTLRPVNQGGSAVRRSAILSGGKSGAMGQLRASAGMSRSAMSGGTAEGQSFRATQAFEGTSAAIGGPGGAIGGSGAGAGQGNGLDAGNPINSVNKSQAPQPADSSSGQNDTPWQNMVYAAMGLLGIGALLLMAGSQLNKTNPLWGRGLAIAAAAAGAAAAAIGLVLITRYHQNLQGAIFLGGGALLGVMAAVVAMGGDQSNASSKVQAGAAAKTLPKGSVLWTGSDEASSRYTG